MPKFYLRSSLCKLHFLLVSLVVLTLQGVHAQEIVDVTPGAQAQINALLAEKASRTPVQQKIDSQLLYGYRADHGLATANGVSTLSVALNRAKDGRVLVDINTAVTDGVLKTITRGGGTVVNTVPTLRAIRAYVFLESVESIATLPEVTNVRPADEAETHKMVLDKEQRKAVRKQLADLLASFPPAETSVGANTTEGDVTHRANLARNGIPTSGIRIGVLSDSIDDASGSYAKALASGDVSPVTVLPGQAGSGAAEGLAMLEIVNDLCPGAQLYFASAFNGQAQFAQNIRDLRAAGCDIIIDDVSYFAEFPFADDNVAQAVNDVTASGAFYFSSAANSGSKAKNSSGTWEGDFVDGGAFAAPITDPQNKGYRIHQFSDPVTGVTQNYDSFPATTPTGGGNRYGFLFWSDTPNASANDYDLFYLSPDGAQVIRASTNVQNGTPGQLAYESFGLTDQTAFVGRRFVVAKAASAAPRFLRLATGRGYLTISTVGETHGHSAAADAFSCAATPVAAPASGGNPPFPGVPGPFPAPFNGFNRTEIFSSDGPRRIFYNVDSTGTNYTPVTPGNLSSTGGTIRLKPDVTAADGVTTTLPANSGLNPFYGTSASAPHAGAIAGILLAKNPSLTNAQMRAALTSTATDIEGAGYDNLAGYGILDAVNAVNAVSPGPGRLSKGIYYRVLTPGGDGQIRRGETFRLYVSQTNTGGNTSLDGVTGTLTSNTPGVIVRARPVGFPSLAPGQTAESTAPFQVNVATTLAPGANISLTYTSSFNGATSSSAITLPTTVNASPDVSRFDFNGPPISVPDANPTGINIPFTVTGLTTPVGKVTFSLFADPNDAVSSFIGDLVVTLISPDNKRVVLINNIGGSSKTFGIGTADDQRLTLDDAAATPLGSAAPPYAGRYQPSNPLSGFVGAVGNGTWTLNVVDSGGGDVSKINVASLFVQGIAQ